MRLQADPTVQYALGQHVARVLYKHLEIDSPYNTYRYAGLPPGPIASPGKPAIVAALYPGERAVPVLRRVSRRASRVHDDLRAAQRRGEERAARVGFGDRPAAGHDADDRSGERAARRGRRRRAEGFSVVAAAPPRKAAAPVKAKAAPVKSPVRRKRAA